MDSDTVILGDSARKAECYYQTKGMKMTGLTGLGAIFIAMLNKISFSIEFKLSYH